VAISLSPPLTISRPIKPCLGIEKAYIGTAATQQLLNHAEFGKLKPEQRHQYRQQKGCHQAVQADRETRRGTRQTVDFKHSRRADAMG
jgi:hypothetical protein